MEIQNAPSTLASVLSRKGSDDLALENLHIVDQLIAERGITLVKHPIWPVIKPALYKVLHYKQAVRMADAISDMSAHEAFQYISDLLKLDVQVRGRENLPKEGGFILVSNHPTGIPDGVAVYDMIRDVRPDLVFFANRDAIRVNPDLAEIIIPVEWRQGEKSHAKSRETLVRTNRAFNDGRAIVLFPSGRIAYWSKDGLTERPWQATAVQMARRYNVPIIPMNMVGRNSWLFYLLAHRNTELRDMTIFHELLNKAGKTFEMTIGQAIDPGQLDGDPQTMTTKLQYHCEHVLKTEPGAPFPSM